MNLQVELYIYIYMYINIYNPAANPSVPKYDSHWAAFTLMPGLHLERHGDLVSRLITPITHIVT